MTETFRVPRAMRVDANGGVFDVETGEHVFSAAPHIVFAGVYHDAQLIYTERPSDTPGMVWCRASIQLHDEVTLVSRREDLVPERKRA
jgi:hypothetical protein